VLAMERNYGQRSGSLEFVAYFNDADDRAHEVLSPLTLLDRIVTYVRGGTLGKPAACLIGKQINYDPSRDDNGNLTEKVTAQSNGYGIEWGKSLTAGLRTDTDATDGASIDTAASLSLGGQAYLHVSAFAGTDVTIKIQDSADDSNWTDVASFAFTSVTTAPQAQRLQLGPTATIRRYVRVITTTSSGFTSVSFHVTVVKNETAVTF
jgi:hypothetical protein